VTEKKLMYDSGESRTSNNQFLRTQGLTTVMIARSDDDDDDDDDA
jgi:hypothetical protein